MEAEFVNAYVQKQKDLINEMLARVIMLDTRASIAEEKLMKSAEAEAHLSKIIKEYQDLEVKYKELEKENERNKSIVKRHDDQVSTMKKTINELTIERERYKSELNTIRKSINQLGSEA